MSHEINFNEEKNSYSFAAANPAWHNLGTVFGRKMTSKEALEGANLNFEVKKARNHFFSEDQEQIIEGPSYTTYRADNNQPLGTVGDRYTIVQNTEGFDFIDTLAGKENKMIIDSAGVLRNGETVFITAKLPQYIKLLGEDMTEMYLIFTNNHSGSGGISAIITPMRVVCNNTLTAALKNNKRKINLKHTKNVHEKIQMADQIMGKTSKFTQETQELFEELVNTNFTQEQVDYYISRFVFSDQTLEIVRNNNYNVDVIDNEKIPTRRKKDFKKIKEYHESGPGQEKIKGTAFGVYNAVTGFIQNVKDYKSDSIKMESAVMDGNDIKKQNQFLGELINS